MISNNKREREDDACEDRLGIVTLGPEAAGGLRGDPLGPPSHTANAAFVGKSKFSRSVGRAIGNELEERRMETAGSERVMFPYSKGVLKDRPLRLSAPC